MISILSRLGKSTREKDRPLLLAWAIMILSLTVPLGASYANDGEDLLEAALAGDSPLVSSLLEKGTDINHQRSDGATALWVASQEGHEGIVKVLLDKGAEVNHQVSNGYTALTSGMLCCQLGRIFSRGWKLRRPRGTPAHYLPLEQLPIRPLIQFSPREETLALRRSLAPMSCSLTTYAALHTESVSSQP